MPTYGIKEHGSKKSTKLDDFVYKIDDIAENIIAVSLADGWSQGKMYGYVTEDQGIVLPPDGNPEFIYLIDPIDGSRTAQIGAEMACVTMVAVKGESQATFADIEFGITQPIKEDLIYVGIKDNGVYQYNNQQLEKIRHMERETHISRSLSAVYQPYGISLEYQGKVLDPLLRAIGFTQTYPSDSYYALSLIRGQNEIYLNIVNRILNNFPHLAISYGHAKSLYPMDIAAGWLMIKELGGKVTDAYGLSIDSVRLWKFTEDGSWSQDNQISLIAASNETLHSEVVQKIEEGFAKLNLST
jgi:myo-inositol-1(or 4)-monophosphatase